MPNALFYGWRKGILLISLNQLLRKYSLLTLTQAKQKLDDLLAGKPFTLYVSDAIEAADFVARASELGALCRIELVEEVSNSP